MVENAQRAGSLVDDVWSFLAKLLPGDETAKTESAQNFRTADVRVPVPSTSNEIGKESTVDEVRAALSSLLDAKGEAPGAHLRVLGLHTVKSKVGEQWPKFRRTVHITVENVLAKALTKDDRFMRAEDDLYVIAYARTDATAATQRTDAIAAAVLKHLLGTDTQSAVAVRAMSGRIKITDKGSLTFLPLEKGARPEHGRVSSVISTDAAIALIPKPASKPSESEIVWHEDVNDGVNREKEEMDAALQRARAFVNRAPNLVPSFSFTPIWNAKKNAITNYSVVPFGHEGEELLTEHRVLGRIPSDDAILDLDLRCMRIGITEAAKLYDKGTASLICIQVDYRSLVIKTGLHQIVEVCAPVPDFLKKYISVQIVGVPADFSVGFMTDITAMLRPHFRGIVVRAPSLRVPIESLLPVKMHVLTFVQTEPVLSEASRLQLKKVVAGATARQIAVTLEYVPDVAGAREARDLGVTFVTGSCISPLTTKPAAGFRMCGLEDFPLAS